MRTAHESVVPAHTSAPPKTKAVPQQTVPSSDSWPCPLPYSWEQFGPPTSARRRQRWRKHHGHRVWVNLIVCALNFFRLGSPGGAPPGCSFGRPLSAAQHVAVSRIEAHVESMHRSGEVTSSDGGSKHKALLQYIEQLCTMFDHEGSLEHPSASELEVPFPSTVTEVPLQADRLKFEAVPAFFDPVPHLSPFEAAAFLEPRLLEYPSLPTGKPVPGIPRQAGDKSEVLKLFEKWDKTGRLAVFPAADIRPDQRLKLKSVAKSETKDRMIANRQRRNCIEHSLKGKSAGIPGGYAFAEIVLGPSEVLELWASDLSDFYHGFWISEDRARTNCIALEFQASEMSHLAAIKKLKLPPETRVVGALKTLPMGDGSAVDFAQSSHAAVLEAAGAYKPEHRVQGSQPLPRGAWMEALVIDDHVGLLRREASDLRARQIGHSVFATSSSAYEAAGLAEHPDKHRAAQSKGVVLGAEIDGKRGTASSEAGKRLNLAIATLQALRLPGLSGALVRRLCSGWIFAASFAKHSMCVFQEVFRWLGPVEHDSIVRPCPRHVQGELLCMAVLSPLLVANLRAQVKPSLWATDASSHMLGRVRADVPPELAQELWRVRDRKGQYTQLAPAVEALWRAKGLDLDEDEFLEPGKSSIARILIETFDFVEVCCGPNSPLMLAMSSQGLRCGPRIDLLHHRTWDIGTARVLEWLMFLVQRKRVWYVHGGPPCKTFSIARSPKERTKDVPLGRGPLSHALLEGNRLLLAWLAVLFVVLKCASHGTHEHPHSAYSWHVPALKWFMSQPGVSRIVYACCAFGPGVDGFLYRKDTALLAVHCPWLEPLGRRCPGFHKHTRLEGGLTTKAAPYPEGVCTEWAKLAAAAYALEQPVLGQPDIDAAASVDKSPSESVWFNQLLSSLQFVEESAVHVRAGTHINILELKSIGMLLKHVSQEGGECRIIDACDSQVARGVVLKGRSASRVLNKTWRRFLPYSLGSGIAIGVPFAPTRLNPADDPTRHRPVRGPRSLRPPWMNPLSLSDLDVWRSVPRQRKATAEWCRIVLLLWAKHIDHSVKEFDSTLGFPGEGPRRQKLPLELRPAVDLLEHGPTTAAVSSRRHVLRTAFATWGSQQEVPIDVIDLAKKGESRRLSDVLARYGQAMYDSGKTVGDFSETINSVIDLNRDNRRHVQKAWDACRKWQSLIPSINHIPCPEAVMQAVVALLCLWLAPEAALAIAIGFTAMLRPGEIAELRFSDILSPEQFLAPEGRMFVRIRDPKMRRLSARREFVRLDHTVLAQFASALKARHGEHDPLFPGGTYQLRKVWTSCMMFFGIPYTDGAGLTPASLRAGGATWLFNQDQRLDVVKWRGRWACMRTLEIYIQEVAALSVLPSLPQETRNKIQRFSLQAGPLISWSTDYLIADRHNAFSSQRFSSARYAQGAYQDSPGDEADSSHGFFQRASSQRVSGGHYPWDSDPG